MPYVDLNSIKLDEKPDYNNPAVRDAAIMDVFNPQPEQPQSGKFIDLSTIQLDPVAPAQPPAPPQNYATRLTGDLQDAGNEVANIVKNIGNQNPASSALQILGQGAKVASAPVAQGLASLASFIPQGVKDYVSDSAVGDVARQYAGAAGENIGKIQQAYPELSKDAGAALNLFGTLAGGKVATAASAPVTDKALSKLANNALVKDISTIPTPKAPITTASMVKENASNLFKDAQAVGGELKSTFTNKFADDVMKLAPQTEKGKILAGDSPFTQVVEKIQKFRDKPISLLEAQEIDEHLGDIIDSHFTNGRLGKQGQKVLELQSQFRNMIDKASEADVVGGKQGFEALTGARKEWSRAAKLNDIERIMARAEQMDNPATGMKNGFRTLYNNPNRLRGFSKEQQALIKQAAEGNFASDALRTIGSRLISTMVGMTSGGTAGAGAGYLTSAASRKLAGTLGARQAEKIAENIINSGGGMTKAMPSQIRKITLRNNASKKAAIALEQQESERIRKAASLGIDTSKRKLKIGKSDNTDISNALGVGKEKEIKDSIKNMELSKKEKDALLQFSPEELSKVSKSAKNNSPYIPILTDEVKRKDANSALLGLADFYKKQN